jgi:hypothetical protein
MTPSSNAKKSGSKSTTKKKTRIVSSTKTARVTVRTSRAPRGAGVSRQETTDLLNDIESVLPVGPMEWDLVWELHNAQYPEQNRSSLTVRQKFTRLVRTKVPTGDPNPDVNVARALLINERIKTKSEMSDGEGNESAPVESDIMDDSSQESEDPYLKILQELIAQGKSSGTCHTGGTEETQDNQDEAADETAGDGISTGNGDEDDDSIISSHSVASEDKKANKKAFGYPMLRKGSRKNSKKSKNDLDATTDFLKVLMMQQMEESRIRRDEMRESREQNREFMMLFNNGNSSNRYATQPVTPGLQHCYMYNHITPNVDLGNVKNNQNYNDIDNDNDNNIKWHDNNNDYEDKEN